MPRQSGKFVKKSSEKMRITEVARAIMFIIRVGVNFMALTHFLTRQGKVALDVRKKSMFVVVCTSHDWFCNFGSKLES